MSKFVSFFICFLYLLPLVVCAGSAEFDQGLQQAKQIAPSLQQNAYNNMQSFDPKTAFARYDANPTQTGYYQGTTQTNADAMQKESEQNKASNDVAKAVADSIHPRVPNKAIICSPEIQQGLQIQNDADNVIHHDGSYYCLDGDCTDHDYKPSKDFEKALTSLSATNEATKDFDTNSMFKGNPAECREAIGNFSNCCEEKGWGQDINLAHCSDSEKALGFAREKKVASYVGRYCAKKLLNKCIEHKETYCVFSSKLARVIQEQGRMKQLRIDFGDARQAHCQGITPQQLQQIDLSRIDFGQEIIEELKNNINSQDITKIQSLINQHVSQQQTGR